MDETLITYLEPPRFEDGKPLLIAGLCERYGEDFDPMSGKSARSRSGYRSGHDAGVSYGDKDSPSPPSKAGELEITAPVITR